MGNDLGVDAVFLAGFDNVTAIGIVLGIGGENHTYVYGHTHIKATDLYVAFLHDIQPGQPVCVAAGPAVH